jgi:lipopolysaccharide export system protein LptC
MMASEPASPIQKVRGRYDWSARARSTMLDAARYTRFVTRMKRFLSISAFAVIFAVLAFFFVQRAPHDLSMSYEKMGILDNDLAMLNPRLTGADAKGNPFVITAKEAVQDSKNPKRATLKTIEADMTTAQGWVNAKAMRGVVDMAAKTMELDGGIELFTDTGWALRTDRASVDLKANVVRGDKPMSGQGPMGAMRADSFNFDRNSGVLTLTGGVRMTMARNGK